MQQAALFKAQMGDILVVAVQDGKARQDGIAVMAVVIDHVAAIGRCRPDILGQELVLGTGRPVLMALGMSQVQALDFLQKQDIRIEMAQALTQFVHHHPPVELREALVDVEGGDV